MRVLLLAALATVISISACGGSGDGDEGDIETLEVYFEEMQDLVDEYNDKSADLDFSNLTTGFGEAAFAKAQEELSEVIELGTRQVKDLDSLDPPPLAKDAHVDLVSELRSLVAFFGEAAALQSEQELDDFFPDNQSRLQAIVFAAAAACYNLQAIADEHDIAVELCAEESPPPIEFGWRTSRAEPVGALGTEL